MDSQAQLHRTHAQHQAEEPTKIHHPEEGEHHEKGPLIVFHLGSGVVLKHQEAALIQRLKLKIKSVSNQIPKKSKIMTTTEGRKEEDRITTVGHSIPHDLIFEILLKLPSKSVMRFKSVSKSWNSIIRSQQFIEAFMSLSLTRPRLVLSFEDRYDDQVFFFYSSPHRDSSSLSSLSSMMLVAENYNLKMPKLKPYTDFLCSVVRGFLCCRLEGEWLVCNPTTGQAIPLSDDENDKDICIHQMFLGYDPNKDQYKVLRLAFTKASGSYIEHSVCTLGGQQRYYSDSWRPIKTSLLYSHSCGDGVSIDGVVYYFLEYMNADAKRVLISFDVGTEKLRPIETTVDFRGRLTNYLGKLAMYQCKSQGFILWVFDVKNQIWANKTYVFPSHINNELSGIRRWCFGGITASGEIVYVIENGDAFELLFCYDVEKKMAKKRVRLQGLSKIHHRFYHASLFYSYIDNILYL